MLFSVEDPDDQGLVTDPIPVIETEEKAESEETKDKEKDDEEGGGSGKIEKDNSISRRESQNSRRESETTEYDYSTDDEIGGFMLRYYLLTEYTFSLISFFISK